MTEDLPTVLPKNYHMSRKHIFRHNLRRIAKNRGLDRTSLAAEMGLDNAGRKWLGRLWESGIDRPNHKTEHHLGRLAVVLGLQFYGALWKKEPDTFNERIVPIRESSSLGPLLEQVIRELEIFARWEQQLDMDVFHYWLKDKRDTYDPHEKSTLFRFLLAEELATPRSTSRWIAIRDDQKQLVEDLAWLREQISGFGLWGVYSDVTDDEAGHTVLWHQLSGRQTKEQLLERLQVQESGSWCALSALESIPQTQCEMRFLDNSHAAVIPNDEGVFCFRKTQIGSPVVFVLVYKKREQILGTVQLRQGEIQTSELGPPP